MKQKILIMILCSMYSMAAYPHYAHAVSVIEDGKQVTFEYVLSTNGKKIDSSETSGPLTYVHGKNQIIAGLEKRLAGLAVGAAKIVTVPSEEAYGEVNPNAFQSFPKSAFTTEHDFIIGTTLRIHDAEGKALLASVWKVLDEEVILNFNHPLAGRELTFEVTIVDIQ